MELRKEFLYTVVLVILSITKPSVSPGHLFDVLEDGTYGHLYFLNRRDGSGSTFAEITMPQGNGTYLGIDIGNATDFDFLPSEELFLFVDENFMFSWDPKTNTTDGPFADFSESELNIHGIEVDQSRSEIYLQLDNTTDGKWQFAKFGVLINGTYEFAPQTRPKGGRVLSSFALMPEQRYIVVATDDGIEAAKIGGRDFQLTYIADSIFVPSAWQVTAIASPPEDPTFYYSLEEQTRRIFCCNVLQIASCPNQNIALSTMGVFGTAGFYDDYFFPSAIVQLTENDPGVPLEFRLYNISTGTSANLQFTAFDSRTERNINIAKFHFIEGPSLVMENQEGQEGDAKEEFSVLVRPAAIRFQNSKPVVLHRQFPEGFDVSLRRSAFTGNARGITFDVDRTSASVVLNELRRNPRGAVGVYAHDFEGLDDVETVTTVVQWAGKLRFTDATKTVFQNERLVLSTPLKRGRGRRWAFNGKQLSRWNRMPSLTIPNVMEENEGIYEIYLVRRRFRGTHGIIRVIVADCPENRFNAPFCNETTSLTCYNGGILRSDREECICAPGFMGEECETPYGSGLYGQQGQFECPKESCSGMMICLPDPYGCSCAAGYHGPKCDLPCGATTYGASCRGECHCGVNGRGACDPYTGQCLNNRQCNSEWTGVNCQIHLYI